MGWNTYYRFVLLVEGRRRRRAEDGAAVRGGPEMRPCRLTGRSGETRLVDAAPATRPRKPDSGGPQPAVRRHYDRLPTSRAARVDDEGAVATAPDKGRHGLSPTGSTAPRGQKTPQVERREAPSSDRKEEGDASQASRAASPAAQGVSQTPASAGAPLPSGERDEDGSDGVPGAGQRTRAMNRVWIVGWAKARFRAPCPPAERPRGAHAALCAPYDVWDDASALACFPPPKVRYRSREVGGGRATRQPGQVRKEAALTSPVRVVVSLPPNSTPRRQSRAEHAPADGTMSEPANPAGPGSAPAEGGGYRVLARKYRPASFEDLIGQEPMVRTVSNAFDSGRIPQAWILTGVRGVGKTTTARILARALNYELPDGSVTGPTIHMPAMGVHCQAIIESRHIDVLEMDAASHNGVEDVRQINDAVRYAPVSARYKVYILDEVHMLSTAAFNALLKTLEEPPPHAKFIFATTEIGKVPVTVLSRCQRFDLRRVETAVLVKHLAGIAAKENVEIEDAALALIARASEGS